MAKYSLSTYQDWYTIEALSLLFPPYNNEHEFRHRAREYSDSWRAIEKEWIDRGLSTSDPELNAARFGSFEWCRIGFQQRNALCDSGLCDDLDQATAFFYANRENPECMFRTEVVSTILTNQGTRLNPADLPKMQAVAARRCAEHLCAWPADPHSSGVARKRYVASGLPDRCGAEKRTPVARTVANRLLYIILIYCPVVMALVIAMSYLMEQSPFKEGLALSLFGSCFLLVGVAFPVMFFASKDNFKTSSTRVKVGIGAFALAFVYFGLSLVLGGLLILAGITTLQGLHDTAFVPFAIGVVVFGGMALVLSMAAFGG